MSPKEKTKFEEMAKQDKARYDQEMMNYNPGKKGRKMKDPSAPRRPPYVYACQSSGWRGYLTMFFWVCEHPNVEALQYLNELLLPL